MLSFFWLYLSAGSNLSPGFKGIVILNCSVVWAFLSYFFIRLLVSASQDGKLIIWDSYTTNKVKTPYSKELKQCQWPVILVFSFFFLSFLRLEKKVACSLFSFYHCVQAYAFWVCAIRKNIPGVVLRYWTCRHPHYRQFFLFFLFWTAIIPSYIVTPVE